MTRLYILVEGQTEEAFIQELMVEPYAAQEIYLTPIIVSTRSGHKGGLSRYAKVKPQIERQCKQDPNAYVTTFFDFYALPTDFPGRDNCPVQGTALSKIVYLEQALKKDLPHRNFFPNITLHEFETLLFTDISAFDEWIATPSALTPLRQVRASQDPEEINDSPQTAPSKRIAAAMPEFQKTIHGPLIAATIGLDAIKDACPHFAAWLKQIDALKA
jgi:hypothetical protein